MYEYTDVFRNLTYQTAAIVFVKRNGEPRVMLATRNLHTAALVYGFKGNELGGHDNRCSVKNGNIAVIDMVLGQARSFNIERLVSVTYFGEITTAQQLDEAAAKFIEFENAYKAREPEAVSMEDLD